jgi:hypothetical protein
MKDLQASGEVPEENLDDVVGETCFGLALVAHANHYQLERVREKHERQYVEEQRSGKPGGAKVCTPIYRALSMHTDTAVKQGESQDSCRSG